MNIQSLAASSTACFGNGLDSDVVISSRVRLARNIAEYPFVSRLSVADSKRLTDDLTPAIAEILGPDSGTFTMNELKETERQMLIERHLISKTFGMSTLTQSAACIAADESACVMINEEDHLRIQAIAPGLDLETPLARCQEIDRFLEKKFVYAFDDKLGYLTACPSNLGTGMRASVMMHLPALTLTKQMEKVRHAMDKSALVVRGLFGEGEPADGDYFQISNQVTLGYSEEDLVGLLMKMVPCIVDYERKARTYLLKENRESITDRANRALEILRNTQSIKTAETLALLSNVRLGVCMGVVEGVERSVLDMLFLRVQPAHLQLMEGSQLDASDRDLLRAKYLRRALK